MSRTMPRRIALLAACVAVTLPNPILAQQRVNRGAGPAPAPGTIFLVPERVPVRDGALVEGERGLVFVPMSRADTSRGVVGIEVWRFRALQPTNAPPVFRLPGGPGHDGLHVNLADQGYYERAILPTIRFADYVIVGQRGIATSPPNTLCENDRGAELSRRCREYWERAGLDPRAFNVNEAAHDVADVARALGYDSIVVRGGSFGSHWTLALMRLHPRLVARALLSGTEGPDHTYDLPAQMHQTLRRIAATAERDPQFDGLLPPGGLLAALDSVHARLKKSPVTLSVVVDSATGRASEMRLTEANLPNFAMGYSASAGTRSGVRTWPADVLRLYYGDFTPAARRLARRMDATGAPSWPFSYSWASATLLNCASGGTPSRLARIEREPAKGLVGGSVVGELEICAPWNVDLGDDFRRNFDTNIPTVVVHGTWDLNTPYENALELMPFLRRGRLVTIVGGSHLALAEATNFDRNFASAIDTFLRTGAMAQLPDSVALPATQWTVPPDLKTLAAKRLRPE